MTILSVPNLGKILKNDNSEFFSVPGNISNYYNSEFFNRGNISKNNNSEFSNCGNNDNININSVSQNLNNKFDVSPSSIGRLSVDDKDIEAKPEEAHNVSKKVFIINSLLTNILI